MKEKLLKSYARKKKEAINPIQRIVLSYYRITLNIVPVLFKKAVSFFFYSNIFFFFRFFNETFINNRSGFYL
jgi:hypothetical protein